MQRDKVKKKVAKKKTLSNSKVLSSSKINQVDRPSTVILEGVKQATGKGAKRLNGLSIKTKFAFTVSVIIVIICGFLGVVVYSKTQSFLMNEIDRKGLALVKSIANIAKQYYNVSKGQENNDSIKKEFSKYLVDMSTVDGERESPEILGVAIESNIPGVDQLSSGNIAKIIRTYETEYEEKIKIVTGRIISKEGVEYLTRAYKKEISFSEGTLTAFVTLSEDQIRSTSNDISFNIFLASLIAIVIGIIASFFLSSHITNPVRKLMKDIEVVARGKLDHKTHPTSRDEIGILAHTFNVMTQNLRTAHHAELENQAREHELQIATEIQSNLLPKEIPQIKGYDIDAFYLPSKEVGGDYYDFIDIDAENMVIVVADVSGKGIPGSMVMAMTRSLVRMEAMRSFSPKKVLAEINRVVAQDISRGMFVTAMYCILNKTTGQLKISSAGHNPAVIVRAKGDYELINTKGLALGLDKGKIFSKQIEEKEAKLSKGDRLVLYTDGIPEAMSPQKKEFGDERFYDLACSSSRMGSKEFIQGIISDLDKWRKNAPQSDDITIVTLKV